MKGRDKRLYEAIDFIKNNKSDVKLCWEKIFQTSSKSSVCVDCWRDIDDFIIQRFKYKNKIDYDFIDEFKEEIIWGINFHWRRFPEKFIRRYREYMPIKIFDCETATKYFVYKRMAERSKIMNRNKS